MKRFATVEGSTQSRVGYSDERMQEYAVHSSLRVQIKLIFTVRACLHRSVNIVSANRVKIKTNKSVEWVREKKMNF